MKVLFFLLCFFCMPGHSMDSPNLLTSQKTKSKPFKILLEKKTAPVPFKVELVTKNQGIPWGMVFLNPQELLWTEREGSIKKIHLPTGHITSISGGPKSFAIGQGGLLDVILHPEFKTNQWIYFSYTVRQKRKQSLALARGRLKDNRITELKTLWVAKPFYSGGLHFGSRLAFDKNSFLFMTVGDRGRKQTAQNLNSYFGKLLRFNDKGQAPADNPFIKTKKAKPEIWSFGHRNPQGLFIHPETQQIYLQEHGPKGGDEINLIKKGGNYGWPVITYGRAYSGLKIGKGTHKKGMIQPIKYWTPSIAPCGLLIYSGKKFPKWKGDFFSGALALTHLNKLKIQNNKAILEEKLLEDFGFRFRHVIESPQGFIYASVDQGKILKISPL